MATLLPFINSFDVNVILPSSDVPVSNCKISVNESALTTCVLIVLPLTLKPPCGCVMKLTSSNKSMRNTTRCPLLPSTPKNLASGPDM